MENPQNNFILQENPNPNAKIGFVVLYPSHFYPLKNIYAKYGTEAEFIVHYCLREKIPGHTTKRLVKFLGERGVFFRILTQKTHTSNALLHQFFNRYRALVGTNFSCCFDSPVNRDRAKIRVEYGAGKDLTKFHPTQSKFDLILLYGERSAELYKFYTHCTIVGNTRFDDWFNDELDQKFIAKTKTKLNSAKKTILYVPTFDRLSAIDALTDALVKIRKNFNVIIKLHHRVICDEPQQTEILVNKGFMVFDDSADTLLLYKIADVVLADNSSALFEALLAKKPLITADFLSREFLEEHRLSFRSQENLFFLPQTYSGSIEQQIKTKATICIKNPNELEDALNRALNSPDKFSEKREEIIQKIFSFNDGKCSWRAKRAIDDFLSQGEPPPKPILYYVFDAFSKETRIRTLNSIKKMPLFQKLKFIYRNLL